jgi:predicted transcriptional regulator
MKVFVHDAVHGPGQARRWLYWGMPPLPKPTEAELSILRVIWQAGPSTVGAIREVLDRTRPTGYTTVLKLLQIMTAKGLVRREDAGRLHIYHASWSETRTQRQLLRDLLDRAFGGSADALVMQALATTRASAAEMKDVERMLARRRRPGGRKA